MEQDLQEAVKWYRKAAEQGFAIAQYRLARCCRFGDGVEQDLPQAVKWYRMALPQDDDDESFRCALQAFEQELRQAAEQGDAGAQYQLARCYREGLGVEMDMKQNLREAAKWYRKAAGQGHAQAQQELRQLESKE